MSSSAPALRIPLSVPISATAIPTTTINPAISATAIPTTTIYETRQQPPAPSPLASSLLPRISLLPQNAHQTIRLRICVQRWDEGANLLDEGANLGQGFVTSVAIDLARGVVEVSGERLRSKPRYPRCNARCMTSG